MKLKLIFITALCITLPPFFSAAFSAPSKEKIIFGGGPSGEAFWSAANAIHNIKSIKDADGFKLQVQQSDGSLENLKKINDSTFQMGIVYSGDLWRAVNGRLINYQPDADANQNYSKVMAVASLYTAPAQLIVRGDSDIKSVTELEGKKVGVGNTSSGAYSTCELFFTHMGIWDKIEKKGVGYNDAARAFKNNDIDAFWIFTAAPSACVKLLAENSSSGSDKKGINIVNLGEDAEKSNFFKEFPWFSITTIKAGTYKGVDTDTISFQDSAIWAASSDTPADVVYQMMSLVYTDEALKYLAEQNGVLKDMNIATGITAIFTPLHPGAEKFWKEKGIIK